MAAARTVDGSHALTRFFVFCHRGYQALAACIERDAEALRILTTPKPLDLAVQRVEIQEARKQLDHPPLRRIWTRADERRVLEREGLADGRPVKSRTSRLLARLDPRSGFAPHAELYRLAVEETRRDGSAAVVLPLLKDTRQRFDELLAVARAIGRDECEPVEFKQLEAGFLNSHAALIDYTRPAGSRETVAAKSGNRGFQKPNSTPKKPPLTCNQQMAVIAAENPEAMAWTSTQWSKEIPFTTPTITASECWKLWEPMRLMAKANRRAATQERLLGSGKRRNGKSMLLDGGP